MKKIPKLYSPFTAKFWSLRTGMGYNGGVVFDCDYLTTRKVMRILTKDGWKYQIIGINKSIEWCEWDVIQDQEILDEYGEQMEFEE